MIKSDFNRCFIFGPKMRIFGRFGPLWPFWPIYWPEIQKNMFHTFHICPGKPPQGGIQNLRFLGGRIIFTIENTSVKQIHKLIGLFDDAYALFLRSENVQMPNTNTRVCVCVLIVKVFIVVKTKIRLPWLLPQPKLFFHFH